MGESDDDSNSKEPRSGPLGWFIELRPLLTIVLTAIAGGVTTYCSVDRHGQRMQEQEVDLKNRQFEAEQLAKYLALPEKAVMTKSAMATYLQAVYFSSGQVPLHKWATRQIDDIRLEIHTRRALLAGKRAELEQLRRRRDEFSATHTVLAVQLAGEGLSAKERAAKQAQAKELAMRVDAATLELNRLRAEFDEETLATVDLHGVANAAAAGAGYCEITELPTAGQSARTNVIPLTAADCAAACLGKSCSARFMTSPPAPASTTNGLSAAK